MGCDRVVIASTLSQGNKTTVTWLSYKMTGLENFSITLVQDGTPTTFEAKPTDTSIVVTYTAAAGCKATVTPRTADGPSNDNASFATPVPFPPPPIDPSIQRAVSSMCTHMSPMIPLPYSMNVRHQRLCGNPS